jgi:hypothetical protein
MRKTLELHPHERDLASLAHEGIAVALKDKGETESSIVELGQCGDMIRIEVVSAAIRGE